MASSFVTFNKKTALRILEGFYVANAEAVRSEFQKKVMPKYSKILERNAKKEAKKVSRSGDLVRGIYVTGGKTGRQGVALRVKGPARKYARILNSGGVIRAKDKLLTEPTKINMDRKGRIKKGIWQLPKKQTFTITPKYGFWSQEIRPGEKVVFRKDKDTVLKRFFRRRTRGTDGKLRKTPAKVKAVFILRKIKFIQATHWADNAHKQSLKELHTLMIKTLGRIQKIPLEERPNYFK